MPGRVSTNIMKATLSGDACKTEKDLENKKDESIRPWSHDLYLGQLIPPGVL